MSNESVLLPPGIYKARVRNSEVTLSKVRNRILIKVRLGITQPKEYRDKIGFYYNILEPLYFMHPAGMKRFVKGLTGRSINVQVTIEEYADRQMNKFTPYSNCVAAYEQKLP